MIAAVVLLAGLAVPAPGQDGQPPRPPEPRLRAFGFRGVSLDDGPLRRQLDDARAAYLRIPNDDLLRPFRERAGRPAPGAVLGGWYGRGVFHVFGQIVGGLARLHAATGDPALADKARALVRGFGECIEADGFCFATRAPNAPHYELDKLVGGLVDAATFCGDDRARELLDRVIRFGEKHLARDRRLGDTSTEWYTLSENLWRAAALTGDERHRAFARVWEYRAWWDLLREGRDPFAAPPADGWHAYSHLNTIGGAAAGHEATGEKALLEAAIAAHDTFRRRFAFATGGFGPDERLLPEAEVRARLSQTHASAETQCGAWAVFKLLKRLLRLTGEARFGDWIERQCWNAVAATIPSSPDGRVFYYSDYRSTGGSKFLHGEAWTCCAGTRPLAGAWQAGGRFRYSKEPGAEAALEFEGTAVRWLGNAFDDAGIAEVSIDGRVVARVDQHGPGRDLPFEWRYARLPPGRHTIRIRVTGERSAGSKDCYLNVAGFDVETEK